MNSFTNKNTQGHAKITSFHQLVTNLYLLQRAAGQESKNSHLLKLPDPLLTCDITPGYFSSLLQHVVC